jgi:hypothetical protein
MVYFPNKLKRSVNLKAELINRKPRIVPTTVEPMLIMGKKCDFGALTSIVGRHANIALSLLCLFIGLRRPDRERVPARNAELGSDQARVT